jgi:hypothetical protein
MARWVGVVALLLTLLLGACSPGQVDDPLVVNIDPAAVDASQALRMVQKALDNGDGYRLRVEQKNFVLPRWGGADGGTVDMSRDATMAIARLARTGEPDATYTMTLVGGQTYFRRSTCNESFRVPGGTPDVLRPFSFTATLGLENARDARWQGNAIAATVEGLGPVTIEVDLKTGRPSRIIGKTGSGDLRWTFEAWGVKPNVSKPGGTVQDRGPGGVPC